MSRSRVAVIISALTVVAFAMIVNRFIPGGAEQKYLVDLPMFHAAARAVAAGDNPYDVQRLARYEADTPEAVVQPFPYTPVVTALFRPVAGVSLDTLQPFWMILSCVGVSVLMLLSMRVSHVDSLVVGALMIVLMPVHITLVNGQLESFLAPLVLVAWLQSMKGQSLKAGLILGFVIVLKHAIAPFLLLFVIERKWNVLGWAMVGGIATSLATIPIVGLEPWIQWVHFTADFGKTGASSGLNVSMPYNLSLIGVLSSWGVNSGLALRVIAPLVCVTIVSWLTVIWKRNEHSNHLFLFGAVALLAPFCMPYFWPHHQLYAAPAFLGLIVLAWRFSKTFGIAVAVFVTIAIQSAPALLPHRVLHKAGIMTNTYGLRLVASTLIVCCIVLLVFASLGKIRSLRGSTQ